MKKMILSLLFILMFVPLSKVQAVSQTFTTVPTSSYSSADVNGSYYIGQGNSYNFKNTYFYEVSTVAPKNYILSYTLYNNEGTPNNKDGELILLQTDNQSSEVDIDNIGQTRLKILRNILSVSYQYADVNSVSNLVNASDSVTKKNILATQILIWELVYGVRNDYTVTNYNSPSPNTYDFVKTDSELQVIYENILKRAADLDINNISSLGKTYVMHWNDGKNKYVASGINVGIFDVADNDDKFNITNNNGNLSIQTSDVIDGEEKIRLVHAVGSTGNSFYSTNSNIDDNLDYTLFEFKFLDSSVSQRLLLSQYKDTFKGNIFVKTESGKFNIVQKDLNTNKSLEGGVFKLYKCSSQSKCDSKETATIDMKNKSVSSDIEINKSGLYLIRQESMLFGYEKINDFYVDFSIADDGKITALMDSTAKNVTKQENAGKLSLVIGNDSKYFNIKSIDGMNSNIKVNGTEYRIKDSNGNVVKFKSVSDGKFTYDKNGTITNLKVDDLNIYSVSFLPVGDYILEEISTIYPYVAPSKQLEKELKFRIDSDDFLQVYNIATNSYIKSSDMTLTIKNFKTKVTIIKTGLKSERVKDVVFELYDSDKQNQIPLKKENGEYIYDSSSTPMTLVTDSNGQIIINYLPDGTFYLKEVQTPPDSSLEIDPNNQYTKIEIFVNRNDATAYDYKKEIRNAKGTFCFYKIDEDGNYLNSGKFKLQMYNEKTSKYEDKSLIYNEDKTYKIDESNSSDIYTFTPVTNGQVCFTDVKQKGKYKIVEIEAPEGFILPDYTQSTSEIVINEYGYAIGDAVIINKRVKVGEGAEAQAELIINIQTGQNRIHYIIILITILVIISGLIILKKKIDKK